MLYHTPKQLEWPSQSTDLNLIENPWELLDFKITRNITYYFIMKLDILIGINPMEKNIHIIIHVLEKQSIYFVKFNADILVNI